VGRAGATLLVRRLAFGQVREPLFVADVTIAD
jgi:hypothetical protein